MNFSGDPEMRDELKEKIDDKICRMANKKESYCCKVTDISQTDLSAKFSKSLIMLIGFFFSFNNYFIKYRICQPLWILGEWANQNCA